MPRLDGLKNWNVQEGKNFFNLRCLRQLKTVKPYFKVNTASPSKLSSGLSVSKSFVFIERSYTNIIMLDAYLSLNIVLSAFALYFCLFWIILGCLIVAGGHGCYKLIRSYSLSLQCPVWRWWL